MNIESPNTPLAQDDAQNEAAREAYLQTLTDLNHELKTYDNLSAKARTGEDLTTAERTMLENPAEDIIALLNERSTLVKENYRFHELASAATEQNPTYQHIESHLDGGFGSNFTRSEVFPEGMDVIKFGEDVLERAYKGELVEETIEIDGVSAEVSLIEGSVGQRLVVKVEFSEPVGVNALLDAAAVDAVIDIADSDLDEDVKQRYGGTKIAPGAQKQPTNTMYVIGGPYGPTGKFGLYTVYCGEYAPPAPSERSSEEELKFWESKVWADPEKEMVI